MFYEEVDTMNTAMPIGRDDFAEVRQGFYFVDKSAIIGALLRDTAKVTLFTRPRRFGKTLLMSMLRYFFDVEDAEEHKKLFAGLAVSRDAEAMQQQGTRPVLFLTLKGWKANTWTDMQEVIKDALGRIFDEYDFLLHAPTLTQREQEVFSAIQMGTANIVAYRNALSFLLHVMEEYYGKKPVLLLDEYDVPIQTAWERHHYDDAIDFFREFLSSALKTNASLDFAVLTGVLRIAKESIFSSLNNLKVDSILEMQYPEAFGFTLAEVEQMAAALGREDKLPEIREWYDGYRFNGVEIYNPWSVVNYFDRGCKLGAYWVNTSGNAIIGALMQRTDREHFESLEGLLQGGTVQGYLREGVIYSDIGEDEDALYTMLCTTGYLTVADTVWEGMETRYELRLPNREMLVLFTVEVLKRFQHGLSKTYVGKIMQAFLHGDADRVQSGLSRYLEVLASTFDTARGKEAFYHGFVLGMTAILVPNYEVQSNRESGYGRYDIAVFPKQPGGTGLVLEFKTADSEDQLAAKAQEALQQIAQRDYAAAFRTRGVQQVYRYGIAFCGKQVRVEVA
jgi:hypothetical protein